MNTGGRGKVKSETKRMKLLGFLFGMRCKTRNRVERKTRALWIGNLGGCEKEMWKRFGSMLKFFAFVISLIDAVEIMGWNFGDMGFRREIIFNGQPYFFYSVVTSTPRF